MSITRERVFANLGPFFRADAVGALIGRYADAFGDLDDSEREELEREVWAAIESRRLADVDPDVLEQVGVPRRYAALGFRDFRGLGAVSEEAGFSVETWPLRDDRGSGGGRVWGWSETWCLVLWGPPGTGKTHLGARVLAGSLRAGLSGYWLDATVWFDSLWRLKDELGNWAMRDQIEYAVGVDVLVVDEADFERLNDWEAKTLSRLLLARYSRRGQGGTILTTNNPARNEDATDDEATIESWDWRVASRFLGEDGAVVGLGGKDWRAK